MQGMDLKMPS